MSTTKAILGEKLGMTQIFSEDGRAIPVTVVKAGPCVVTQIRTAERDKYVGVQLGFGEVKTKRINKPEAGHLAKAKTEGLRHLVEFRMEPGDLELGASVTVEQFAAGELVDVVGTSKGHGFTGVMKRHNFGGGRDGHGAKRTHRTPGSVGAGTTPGRVFKGLRGPGRSGNDRVTIQSLEVVEVDAERNLLLIKGAVPGVKGSIVHIANAAKKGSS